MSDTSWWQMPLAKALGRRSTPEFAKLGLHTVGDLMRHYPRRYQRWADLTPLAELPLGQAATILAEVRTAKSIRMRSRPGEMLLIEVTDGTDVLPMTFFNAQRLKHMLRPGQRALFSGKVGLYRGRKQLTHPKLQLLSPEIDAEAAAADAETPIPVYPAGGKLDSETLRRCVSTLLVTLHEVADPLPAEIRARHGLIGLQEALVGIHRPRTDADWRAAQRRLRFEEAFVLQAALARRRQAARAVPATPRRAQPGGLAEAFDKRLPFPLTDGQLEVGEQIAADLAAEHPMHRLLQGEVGSGKTLVALRAMLTVVDAGGQAALLAPTEVLAAQHYRSIVGMLGDLAAGGMLGGDERGTQVALLTGSAPTAVRRKALLAAASGDAGIVIGTHALLQEQVEFFDLGLVVVDEQHRFGVEQRDALRGKGRTTPHLLVMTATPIPRTVAMTVFGDLDTSTLAELPAGRRQITTHVVPLDRPEWFERIWHRVAEEVAAGHQAYVVCPRIGGDDDPEPPPAAAAGQLVEGFRRDSDPFGPENPPQVDGDWDEQEDEEDQEPKVPPAGVLETLPQLREHPALSGLAIEALHGRMPAEEREAVMRRFARGEVPVLVATTVIEVGVDVPNATVMVVLDADRFGVSQLHQLRGRVGRGSAAGLCLLVTRAEPGSPARERLDAVAATSDGFALAQLDLEQRREGDVLGAAQSGMRSSLKLLRVLRDAELIEQARHEAVPLVAADPELAAHPALDAAIRSLLDPDREAYLERA